MSEWQEVILTEITEKIGDGLHGTPKYDENGDYYFINGNNLNEGKIIIKQETKKVNKSEFDKYQKPLSDKTILLGINGTIGNLAFYNGEKCVLGKIACYINVNNNVNKQFLYYNFLNRDFQNFLEGIATGTTIPNVPLKGLRDYTLNLPPLPEQTAIGEVLSSLDDKIDLLHRQNKTLEQLAETLFRQWFVEKAKESWEVSTIGKQLTTVLGGTPSTTMPEYWDGDIPWINSGEVNRFRIDRPTRYITKLGLDKSNTKLLPKGTTVIAITGATLGQISLLEIDTCANQSVVGIIPNDKLGKSFVFFWVKFKLPDILLNETGGAQPHINKNDVNEVELVMPPDELLKSKAPILDDYFCKITQNTHQIRTLTKLRDTLLPKLMSGEVSLSNFGEVKVKNDIML
jgi:type I restriction enzyme S subunit